MLTILPVLAADTSRSAYEVGAGPEEAPAGKRLLAGLDAAEGACGLSPGKPLAHQLVENDGARRGDLLEGEEAPPEDRGLRRRDKDQEGVNACVRKRCGRDDAENGVELDLGHAPGPWQVGGRLHVVGEDVSCLCAAQQERHEHALGGLDLGARVGGASVLLQAGEKPEPGHERLAPVRRVKKDVLGVPGAKAERDGVDGGVPGEGRLEGALPHTERAPAEGCAGELRGRSAVEKRVRGAGEVYEEGTLADEEKGH